MDPWPYIEIHPDAAAELGFTEGEWVWVCLLYTSKDELGSWATCSWRLAYRSP